MVTWTSVETDTARVIRVSGVCHVQLSVTPWTSHQAPLSMGFSRQESWSGLPCPPPGDLPHAGIEPGFVSCIAGRFFTEAPGWLEKRICWWTGGKRWAVEAPSVSEDQTSYREASLALGFPYCSCAMTFLLCPLALSGAKFLSASFSWLETLQEERSLIILF